MPKTETSEGEDASNSLTPQQNALHYLVSNLGLLEEIHLHNVVRGKMDWNWLSNLKDLRRIKVLINRDAKHTNGQEPSTRERVQVYEDKAEFIHLSEETRNIFENVPVHMREKVYFRLNAFSFQQTSLVFRNTFYCNRLTV